MSVTKARQIVLAARPQGKPRLADFRLEETAVPTPDARPGRRPATVALGSLFLLVRVPGGCQS
jgi:NADPH-dependent curcumin reductase CurA